MQVDERLKLAAGVTVGERYVVLAVLGEGGMGQVALVRQNLTKKLGAMKLLTAMAPELVERFNREAAAPSQLNHPAFPTVFDFGQHNGLPYIVMDFVDGITVNGAVRHGHRFSLAEIVDVGRQVCDAMVTAHEAGLVHRDLKPDNLMLVARGGALRTYVLDLGIARFAEAGGDSRTKTGTLIGTPVTMSPEQAQGRHVDGRSDIYSLGCVLFFMASGQFPFAADEPIQLAMKHILEAAPRLDEVAPWVPRGFADVIDRTLRKDLAERFQSMAELDAALQIFASASETPSGYAGRLQTASSAKASTGPTNALKGTTPLPTAASTSRSTAPTVTPAPTIGSLSGTNGEVVRGPGSRRRAPIALGVGAGVVLLGVGAFALIRGKSEPPKPAREVVVARPQATAAPTESKVRLVVTPKDARVVEGARDLEPAKMVIGMPGSRHTVLVSADGYLPQTVDLVLSDQDETRKVDLVKLPAAPATARVADSPSEPKAGRTASRKSSGKKSTTQVADDSAMKSSIPSDY